MEVFDLKVYTLGSFFCFLQSLKPRNSENSAICIPLFRRMGRYMVPRVKDNNSLCTQKTVSLDFDKE